MEILLNERVEKMVHNPPPTDPAVVTEFDIYMHLTLLYASDYTLL